MGRLLAAAGVAALMLLVVAPAVLADEPVRYNCPDGFVWIRMSGTACVQETVPTNGRIGYDGHAICSDDFVGIFEFRQTKNGQPPPGAPYTSFSYLLECVTPEEAARRRAAGTGGELTASLAGPATRRPDAEDFVVIGLTATGGILVAASRFRQPAKPPAGASPGASPHGTPEPAPPSPPAEPAPLPTDPDAIEQRLGRLRDVDEKLGQLADRIREEADAETLQFEDYVAWAGALADILGPLTGPGAPYFGAVSIATNVAELAADTAGWTDVRSVYRDMRGRLEDVARVRGLIAGDLQALERALADSARPPERTPGRIDVDPSLLPDEMLREERGRAQQRVGDTFEADRRAQDEADGLREEQRAERSRLDYWKRELAAFDAERRARVTPGSADRANAGINLAASFDGYVQQYGEDAATKFAVSAADDLGVARAAAVDIVDVADAAAVDEAARGLVDQTKRAGAAATIVGQGTAAVSLYDWFREYTAEQQRVLVEHEVERIAYRLGELDRQLVRADQRAETTTRSFRDEVAHRDAVRAELSRRAEERGHVLWTQ